MRKRKWQMLHNGKGVRPEAIAVVLHSKYYYAAPHDEAALAHAPQALVGPAGAVLQHFIDAAFKESEAPSDSAGPALDASASPVEQKRKTS